MFVDVVDCCPLMSMKVDTSKITDDDLEFEFEWKPTLVKHGTLTEALNLEQAISTHLYSGGK